MAPDSKEYLSKDLEQIPIDERFIYKYLKDKRAKETEEAESDAESVNSEEFNEALDNIDSVDLDFAGNVNEQEIEKDTSDEESEQENDENEELELESLDGEDSDAESLEKEDFDDDPEDFSDEEPELEPPPKKKAKKFKTNDLQSLLASADEFASMIDENAQAEMATDTLGAIFNKDKSHAKQMKWEAKRLTQKRKK